MNDERRRRGLEVMARLFGRAPQPGDLPEVLDDATVGHLFGDVWSRPGLALRDRSLVTCAALTVLGREPQLRVHLKGLLNQGVSRQEVEEMMLHLAHYGGWPVGVSGLRVARELFAELDGEDESGR